MGRADQETQRVGAVVGLNPRKNNRALADLGPVWKHSEKPLGSEPLGRPQTSEMPWLELGSQRCGGTAETQGRPA